MSPYFKIKDKKIKKTNERKAEDSEQEAKIVHSRCIFTLITVCWLYSKEIFLIMYLF